MNTYRQEAWVSQERAHPTEDEDYVEPPPRARARDKEHSVTSQGYHRNQRSQQAKERR